MQPIRPVLLALADSDENYRARVQELLRDEPDLKLLDGPLTIAGAFDAVERMAPDILLLSASTDPQESIAALERLHNGKGTSKTVLLVTLENQDFFVRAVRAGCRGILNKDSTADLMIKCVRKISEGELWLDRATTAQVLRQFTDENPQPKSRERDLKTSPLSPREREIVGLVVQGFKNRELAEKLTISEQTVKNHMHNIFDKLGVSDRLELALYAIHHDLHKPAG